MLRYARLTLGVTIAVIVWGAFVRASGAGAGCGSHWPMCNGEVVPRAPSIETVIELTHRITSGLSFVLILGLAIAAYRFRPKAHPLRRAALFSFVFIVIEAAIGAALVKLELVAENRSLLRAGWMAAHLTNTFLLLGSLTLTVRFASTDRPLRIREHSAIAWVLGIALIGTLIVGVTGAITALGDTLFPSTTLAHGLAQDLSPTAHFLVRLRVWHPVIAVIVTLYTIGAAGLTAMLRPSHEVRRLAFVLVALFLAQIAGGLLNLVLLAPTWMQLVHLAMADFVWIALIALSATALCVERAPALVPAPATA
jgi:heme A synthase